MRSVTDQPFCDILAPWADLPSGPGTLMLLAGLFAAGCAATPAECGGHGYLHGDHCHCDSGYVARGDGCVADEKSAPDGGQNEPDAADAGSSSPGVPDAGPTQASCLESEVRVDGVCLPDDANGCGPRGVLHGTHCHCDAGTFEAAGALYCVEPRACSQEEDALEPNDTPSLATPLTSDTSLSAVACPGNDDWYAMTLEAGTVVTVSLAFRHADGDLDMYLWRSGSDVTHTRPLTGSDSEDDDESFRFEAPTDDTYWLLVYGHRGAEAAYRLEVRWTP